MSTMCPLDGIAREVAGVMDSGNSSASLKGFKDFNSIWILWELVPAEAKRKIFLFSDSKEFVTYPRGF